jgi:hypothetical protein
VRLPKHIFRFRRFVKDVYAHTPFLKMLSMMVVLWVAFAVGLFTVERHAEGSSITVQRPSERIIDSIETNLEQLDDLSIEELDLLKETVDTLIVHVERLKHKHAEK